MYTTVVFVVAFVGAVCASLLVWRGEKRAMRRVIETTEALHAARINAAKMDAATALAVVVAERDELKRALDEEKAEHKKTAGRLANLQRRFGLADKSMYTDAELVKAERKARLERGLGIDMSSMMQDARKRGIIG